MMHGVTEKPATSSSFSERVKNALGNFFPFTMGTRTDDEAETQERRRTMTSKMTSDLKSASLVRLRRTMHTPIERLALWTELVWSGR